MRSRSRQTSQPDSLDPALAFDVGGLQAIWLVYTPLLTYRRDEGEEGAELIPGLASDLPEISDDGRTYTLTLRKGLLYSDGTEVKASDFEHAIKRVLTLDSGGAPFYEGIEGATAYARGRTIRTPTSAASTPTTRRARSRSSSPSPMPRSPTCSRSSSPAPCPGRDAVSRPQRRPAPGVGPVRDHRVRCPAASSCSSERRTSPTSTSPTSRRATSPRSRPRSSAASPSRPRTCSTTGSTTCRTRRRADLMPTMLEQRRSTATPSTRPRSTYYFFLNTAPRAVRRPARPRGGQLRRSTAARSPASTPGRCSPAAPCSPPGVPGLRRGPRHHRAAPTAIRPDRRTRTRPDADPARPAPRASR